MENLEIGKIYVYRDERCVVSLRVGYFLGMIKAQKLSQSFNDDIEYELCYVFATKPTKELWGKKNERVPVSALTKVWKAEETIDTSSNQ